jgi:hypothetical protein
MHAVQAMDLRPDALPVFVAKYAGFALFLLAFFELGRRVLARANQRQKPQRAPENPPT